ncbi:M4 family metallopeptidase [soil metagenome]
MRRVVAGSFTAALVSAVALVSAPTGAHAAPAGHTTAKSSSGSKTAAKPHTKRPDTAKGRAQESARRFVAARPAALKAGKHDGFVARSPLSSQGIQYVPYERTYRGLPVVGGDFVVATNGGGRIVATSVAQTKRIQLASVTAKLTKAQARAISKRQLSRATLESTRLVVLQRASSRLAYETIVRGVTKGSRPEVSRLSVYVDATSGRVISTKEHVMEGSGSSASAGSVTIPTSGSGSSYSMTNTNATTLKCQNATGNATFTGTDNAWGNGDATNRETGCVDAFYAAEQERLMLSSWLGRSGMNGSGGWVPIRVGLNDVNAYYDGTQVQVGHTQTGGKWIGAIDVVAHEFGHGVDDKTPGGISGGGTQEFVADTFGAATEAYANNSVDRPDYTVGEQINLVGNGPIRYMYNPSLAGDANCYSSSTPGSEVHSAAGPGNHWFYLLAEGSSPTSGQPSSPTCNGSSVTGVGIQKAMKIMYNAMLLKTSSSSYVKYRTWSLTAAKNLYPSSCTEFNAVKAAWDAVSVPAQSADPTCSTGGGGGTGGGGTGTCAGNALGNGGFETGSAAPWSASSGVVDSSTGQAAHSGSWKAWMDGYGSAHTDTLSQSVTIPAGCTATLSFYVHIDTAETTTSSAYDKLTVKAGSSTLATYSNLNKASGSALKSFKVSSLAGQTVTIGFTGTEDSSLQTSFVIDDAALTLS